MRACYASLLTTGEYVASARMRREEIVSYEVSYDSESNIVRAHMDGEIEIEEFMKFASDVVQTIIAHDCRRYLNDISAAVMKLSTTDIWNIPRIMEKAGMPPATRRALVTTEDDKEVSFAEAVSHNVGQTVKIFTDLEKAEAWLMRS